MTEQLHLIARIAGQRVALPTTAIDSVVEIDAVTPVPRAPPHVAGLAALRSRVLTLIDCEAALDLPVTPQASAAASRDAVVLACDNHLYGLLVDAVEDVVALSGTARPLRSALGAGWARVASGWIEHDGATLLVLDPIALLAGPASAAAA